MMIVTCGGSCNSILQLFECHKFRLLFCPGEQILQMTYALMASLCFKSYLVIPRGY